MIVPHFSLNNLLLFWKLIILNVWNDIFWRKKYAFNTISSMLNMNLETICIITDFARPHPCILLKTGLKIIITMFASDKIHAPISFSRKEYFMHYFHVSHHLLRSLLELKVRQKMCLIEILNFSSLVTADGPRGADALKIIKLYSHRTTPFAKLWHARWITQHYKKEKNRCTFCSS